MINISNDARLALKNEAPQKIIIEVFPLSGNTFEITDSDILLNGFKYETHSVDSDELQIGNMNSAVLEISLDNESGKFNNIKFAGAVLKPKIGIVLHSGEIEWINFGEFTVDEQPHTWSTIELTAYDNMVRLDIPFDYTIFPISIKALVETGITSAGLVCNDYSMFPDLLVQTAPSQDNLTWRQVIMWCCQCAGINGIADELGNIKFGYYKKYTPEVLSGEDGEIIVTEDGKTLVLDGYLNADYELPASQRYIDGMSIDEEDIIITGHQFVVDDVAYPANAITDYCLQTSDNQVFEALSEEDKNIVATTVNSFITGFTYRPFNSNIVSLPILQTLDSIDYKDEKGRHYSIITNIEYQPNGVMNIQSKGKSAQAKGYASLGSLTSGQKAIINRIDKDIEKTQNNIAIEARTRMAINEAMYNSMGFYSTTVTNNDGSQIKYCHDKPLLKNSKIVYKITLEGTAWTTDYNGDETVWQYGVDVNGNAVFSTLIANNISADIIKSGILQSKNGASWINMNDGTFCFRIAELLDTWYGSDGSVEYVYDYTKVLELTNKILSIYGVLKSIKHPQLSVSIGKSENSNWGAFTVTDNSAGYGDILQTYRVEDNYGNKGVTITAPFLINSEKTNRKGITILPDNICLFNDKGAVSDTICQFALEDGKTLVSNGCVHIEEVESDIRISNSHNTYQWVNWGSSNYESTPSEIRIGNGTQGGYAGVRSGTLKAHDYIWAKEALFGEKEDVYYPNYTLSVFGGCKVDGIAVSSDRKLKKNIKRIAINALDELKKIKFYSYDRTDGTSKKEGLHIKMGIMADEAPKEVLDSNGDGIDLYSYSSFVARALQELSERVEQQSQEIESLKGMFNDK